MVKFFRSKGKKQKETTQNAQKAPPRTTPPTNNNNNIVQQQHHHHPNHNRRNEDEQAVQYWREKQDPTSSENNSGGGGLVFLTNTYEISKHPPIHPANGNILHPSVTTPEKKKIFPSQGGAFERFQPTVQKRGLVMSLSQDDNKGGGGDGGERREQLQIAGLDHNASFDSRFASGGADALFTTPPRNSSFVQQDQDNTQWTQLDPFGCLPESLGGGDSTSKDGNKSFGTPMTAASTAPLNHSMEEEEDAEDHLSDVGSEVSFETKERYLTACRMLKDGLVHKSLHKSDREFILELLRDAEATDMEDGSVVTMEKMSLLETAASRLESAPDSTTTTTTTTTTARAPPPAAITTTKTKKKKSILSCNPKKAEEIQEPLESTFPEHQSAPTNQQQQEPSESSAAVPEQQSVVQRQHDDQFFVRFDGWANTAQVEYPFSILGAPDAHELKPRVLTPRMMEAMRGFFPIRVSESNFWLKFSLVRDGASLATLLESIKASTYTIIAVETTHGEVFGSFTGTPWRRATKWFGNGEAFLWRLKKSRITTAEQAQEVDFENEMEVFPYTGYDDMVQYCTSRTIAVGGGDWLENEFPFENEPRGIGFMLDGDLVGGESSSSATFSNPRLCKKASWSNEFKIGNMEVWTLTPFDNEEDAAQLEMHKLFLESNARRGVV